MNHPYNFTVIVISSSEKKLEPLLSYHYSYCSQGCALSGTRCTSKVKMKAVCSSETLVLCLQYSRRYNLEDQPRRYITDWYGQKSISQSHIRHKERNEVNSIYFEPSIVVFWVISYRWERLLPCDMYRKIHSTYFVFLIAFLADRPQSDTNYKSWNSLQFRTSNDLSVFWAVTAGRSPIRPIDRCKQEAIASDVSPSLWCPGSTP
jgi:hypothetical protein